jgi:phosphatidylserine synthase 2
MNERRFKSNKRNVGVQSIVQPKDYIPPKVAITHNLETVEYPKIFTIPHNVFALAVASSIIIYFSLNSSGDFQQDSRKAIWVIIFTFFGFGALFLPDSIFRRPHPIFWRLIQAASILYLFFVIFVLFQERDQARNFLKFFDSNLGKPLQEKLYAEKCELTQSTFPYINLDNFLDSIDFYLTAHLLGWFFKTLIVRDVKLCWFLSIFFEFLEITFRHWLPNFWECWWDQLILDVLVCNGMGIWLGSITCQFFEMKNYKWVSKGNKILNLKFLDYFQPNIWVKHDWNIFKSSKRFLNVLWYIIFLNLVDLSHFFMKYILWLPPTHDLLHVRIYIWVFLAMISTREYYEYINEETPKRFGHFLWISHIVLLSEWMIIYKFSSGVFTAPFPNYVTYSWVFIFTMLSVIISSLIVKDIAGYLKKSKKEKVPSITDPNVDVEYIDD